MKALILSCDTGGGHNSCSAAIRREFEDNGIICDVADALGFISKGFSKFMSVGHSTMYRCVPWLFRFGYGFAEKHRNLLEEKAFLYKALTSGTENLYVFLKNGGYDTVITTHVFSGMLLQQLLKEYPLELKTAFVATDYTASPGMPKGGHDFYFIPSPCLADEFMEKGAAKEKIIPVGIPVRSEFCEHGDKNAAKRKFGIDFEHAHILMMCGSMGCGPIEKLAVLLANRMKGNMRLSIVCGTNEKLCRKLKKKFALNAGIHVYGFVSNINELMDSADLYITKPGGLSTSEAAAKGLPMVLIDAVAGCEKHNLEYFVSLGGAVTGKNTGELAEISVELLQNEEKRTAMENALKSAFSGNSVKRIFETMNMDSAEKR